MHLQLTGAGRAFSSGQDLSEDLPRSPDGRPNLGEALDRDYNPLIRRLFNFPKVTIAALNGPAVGASANIALACDVVIAARSAYLQQAFAQIALIPDAGGTWILPRLVGAKRALALMLTAGLYERSGDWLYEIGLPAKSGVSGGLVTIAPGKGGLATFSPPLDAAGNSVRGQLATKLLSEALGLDLLASAPAVVADRRDAAPTTSGN